MELIPWVPSPWDRGWGEEEEEEEEAPVQKWAVLRVGPKPGCLRLLVLHSTCDSVLHSICDSVFTEEKHSTCTWMMVFLSTVSSSQLGLLEVCYQESILCQ
jgi:hypothetical protein